MKKKRLTILLILLSLVFAVSCGKVKRTVTTTTSTTTTSTTTTTSGGGTTTTTTTTSTTTTTLSGGGSSTYYVATTGSDSTGDGSESNPWATPGYGSRQLQAGDTLVIKGGKYILTTYTDDIIIPQNSGTAGNPITIIGELTNRPTLAAQNTAASVSSAGLAMFIDLSGLDYITVQNLELTHDPDVSGSSTYVRDGIAIGGSPSSNITLKDLYIHHIDQFGLNFQDIDNLLVQNCTIEYTGFGSMGGPDTTLPSGGGWTNVVIDNCDLSYNGHYYQGYYGVSPSNPYGRPDGIGLEESDGPIEVKNTLAEHNRGDGIDLKSNNIYVHETIIANNTCDGLKLWGDNSRAYNVLIYGSADGVAGSYPWANIVIGCPTTNASFEIVNVTIHDNPQRSAYSMYVQYDERIPIRLTMKNNIIYNSQGLVWLAPEITDYTIENNLFDRANSDTEIYIGDSNRTIAQLNALTNCSGNISGDPLFVSPAWGTTGDYQLQSGSPAIDSGTSSGAPSIDIDDNSRPQGSAVDIGAYEQ